MSATTGPPLHLPFPVQDDQADGADQIQALAEAVAQRLVAVTWPSGSIMIGATANPPAGFFLCNGAELVRVEWPELFNAIGVTYGAGDGVLTFNIPDARQCCVRVDPQQLGWRAGADTVALTVDQLPPHAHGVGDPGHAHSAWQDAHNHGGGTSYDDAVHNPAFYAPLIGRGDIWSQNVTMAGAGNNLAPVSAGPGWTPSKIPHSHSIGTDWRQPAIGIGGSGTGIWIGNTGGGGAHSNLPRILNVNAFIKT